MRGKIHLLVFALLILTAAQVQAQSWTRITTLPQRDFYALEIFANTMYAGATDTIFISTDKGATWTARILTTGAREAVNAITVYNGRIYAGTSNGVYMSSNNGVSWAKSNFNATITSFTQWNGWLYASTDGFGMFQCTQTGNAWSPFNQNYPLVYAGGVTRVITTGRGLFAAAGLNGAGYRYDSSARQWEELFYLGAIAPGMSTSDILQGHDGSLFALNNVTGLLRSNDTGTHWYVDSTDMRKGMFGVLLKGSRQYYVAWNTISGAWLQSRDIDAPVGSSWAAGEEFIVTGALYSMREFDRKLFTARNDGIYYKLNGSAPAGIHTQALSGMIAEVYPNPSEGGAVTVRSAGVIRLEVLDMTGRLVLQAESLPAYYQVQLPTPGLYIFRMATAQNELVSRKVQVR